MFCTGTFERVLDDKQRLLLPKTVKKSLSQSESIYLTPGQDGCLELHGIESLEIRSKEITNTQNVGMKKAFSRLFYSQTERCQFDSQNRIRIPQRLLEWSRLESKIIVVGVGGYWEIWNECLWQDYCGVHRGDFDHVAETVLSNGAELAVDTPQPHPATVTKQSSKTETDKQQIETIPGNPR